MAASLVYDPRWQLIDGDGDPFPGAKLETFAAGTDTPQAVYTDVDLTIPHANPVIADADGRFPLMFLLPVGYKLIAYDADDVQVWSADDYSDPGTIFAEKFGTAMTVGSIAVTDGYTVTATDRVVTVASVGATTINLPAVTSRTQPVAIKNTAGGTVVVTPDGSDTIDLLLATYTIPAAVMPSYPTAWFYPLPSSGTWLILASHDI